MTRAWVRELTGWMLAAAVAVTTAAAVASSPRAELLFRDGDSLVVAMLARSLLAGEKLDWAMSSVLFLPESALFAAIEALSPFGVNGVLALSAVLNMLAVYGAIRLVAGRFRAGMAPVTWSVLAIALFGALAMTETSASRDALELASLALTTTYYSATVIGVLLSIGIVRRMLDSDARSIALPIALGVVAALSTLTNPLFAAWATVPLVGLLAIGMVRAPRRRRILMPLAVLVGSTALGFILRIPFAAWIANTGAGYAQPARWMQSIGYYGGLVGDRLSTPLGVFAALVVVALLAFAIWRTATAEDAGSRFVAAAAWTIPLVVTIGAIALGTHAARYLQPVVFVPLLALVAVPRAVSIPARLRRQTSAVAAVLLLIVGGLSIPRLVMASQEPDADLACVTDWVDASDRTGAGQFWTVRLPKLHLEDPAQLVQVDHQLNGYTWLVNRTDVEAHEVSFLVEDGQTVEWDLPIQAIPDDIVDCGRYRILDFGDASLPLGPPHS